jgi:hypothetical protein
MTRVLALQSFFTASLTLSCILHTLSVVFEKNALVADDVTLDRRI